MPWISLYSMFIALICVCLPHVFLETSPVLLQVPQRSFVITSHTEPPEFSWRTQTTVSCARLTTSIATAKTFACPSGWHIPSSHWWVLCTGNLSCLNIGLFNLSVVACVSTVVRAWLRHQRECYVKGMVGVLCRVRTDTV